MGSGDFHLGGAGVVVTGAAGHLGSAISTALVRAGAMVGACGRSRDSLEAPVDATPSGWPGSIVAEVADVGNDTDLERVLDRVEREAGSVQGWVNNAVATRGGAIRAWAHTRVCHPEAAYSGYVRSLGDVAVLVGCERIDSSRPTTSGGRPSPKPETWRSWARQLPDYDDEVLDPSQWPHETAS